jgi:hypothetical protein
MAQQPTYGVSSNGKSIWQTALGVFLGNLGCFVLYLLFVCVSCVVLQIVGVSLTSLLGNLTRLGP